MEERIRKLSIGKGPEAVSLGVLIHQAVRTAIEQAVHEELAEALGADAYERGAERRGYRNGRRERTLSGPTGPVALTVPRATLFTESGKREWSSRMLPRYQRRLPELNEAIAASYLSGTNTRRIKGALKPLLKAAPLSKSAVSRVVSHARGRRHADRGPQRQQVLHRRDLLLVQEDIPVLEHRLHPLRVGDEVGREVAAVELCPRRPRACSSWWPRRASRS